MTWISLPSGTCASMVFEESDELLMAVALHVATDDRAFENVKGSEQGCGAVPLIVVGHCAGPPLLHRQSWLGSIEGLNLAFFVDREHDGMSRWIDVEPD